MNIFFDDILCPEASTDRLGLALLQQLGLIKFEENVELVANGQQLNISFAYVTNLGAEFFYCTNDPLYRLTPAERPVGRYPDDDRIAINAPADSYVGTLHPSDVLGR